MATASPDPSARLLKSFPCKINLIPFNPFPGSDYCRPSNNAMMRFKQVLSQADFTTTLRTTRGDDIDAACGQLIGRVLDRTQRSQRHRSNISKQVSAEGVKIELC